MLSYADAPSLRPARPEKPRSNYLSGKPIRYYRPRGSADIRQLIDDGFQAFNAARLGEACRIFTDKMLLPEHDTTIGLTVAGAMTPAGLGGCMVELMERGLVDFVISTGANLYHDLHYALNFTLHRGSPFVNDVELYEEGVIRIYDVLFPATVLLETDAYIRDFLVRSGMNGPVSTAELHYALGRDLLERAAGMRGVFSRRRGRRRRRADLHLVARRQLDRHEHRLSRADERQPPDDRPEQGRERGVRVHPGREEERLRDPWRRLAEEFLPAGAADAVGGLRHPERRQRLLHPDHDRPGRLGRAVRGDAGRSRELGQGQSGRAAGHRRRLLRFDDRLPAVLRIRRGLAERPPAAQGAGAQARRTRRGAEAEARAASASIQRPSRRHDADLERHHDGHAGVRARRATPQRLAGQPRVYVDANVPAGLVAFMRTSLHGTCCS